MTKTVREIRTDAPSVIPLIAVVARNHGLVQILRAIADAVDLKLRTSLRGNNTA